VHWCEREGKWVDEPQHKYHPYCECGATSECKCKSNIIEPIKLEPIRYEPIEPIKLEPVKYEPIETLKFEPIKFEPVKFEPIKFEPIKPLKYREDDC
jgi:hypothetical protein